MNWDSNRRRFSILLLVFMVNTLSKETWMNVKLLLLYVKYIACVLVEKYPDSGRDPKSTNEGKYCMCM